MLIAPERFASRRDTLAFVVCILLSVAARVAPVEFQFGVAAGIRSTILAPFLAIQNQTILLRTARASATLFDAQRDSVALEVLELLQLREENRRLRELMELSLRLPGEHVSAEVLHQAGPTGLTLLVSAGTSHGVGPMDPVVAPGGLLGVVQSSAVATSVVLIWTHPDFRASAITEDGSALGIVAPGVSEGPNTELMELRGVPFRELVPTGTRVFTSGLGVRLGGVYPRGIPLGTVVSFGEEREGWSRNYVVQPAVQPSSVSHVIILTGATDDVESVFEGDSL